jgi:hypothetical protein
MRQPSASADLVRPRFPRQVILGAALLIGLASALAPRTSAVHAQEPAAPPAATAPAGKSQSASKTITITNGRTSAAAKIEIKNDPSAKGSATPGDSPDDVDATADADGKSRSGRHGVFVGKHGRVTIDGLGMDREFDSVGDFVHDEPAIAAMVVAIVTVVFLSPVLVIGLILWYRFRKARMLNETMLKLAEKGVVTSSDALEAIAGGKPAAALQTASATAPIYEQAKQIRRRAAWSDLRKGVFTGGVGLALIFYSMLDDGAPNGLGLVLFFVGAGFIVLWWFEERQFAPRKGATAGVEPSIGAPPPPPGGSPPSA